MRSYKQFCGLAKALDMVGERWTLLILRELVPGGRRYSDLHRSLVGITTNLLAKRLQHLEAAGVVARRVLPPPASATVYELTDLGRELEPAMLALGRFGAHWLDRAEPEDRMDVRWLMVSLRRRYLGGLRPVIVQIWSGGVPYNIRLNADDLVVRDGAADEPDVAVRGSAQGIAALLGAGHSPAEAQVEVTGDASILLALQEALTRPAGDRPLRTSSDP